MNTIGAPLVFHTASCETAEEIIKIQQCHPETKTECEDVEVPSQKMEYVVKCQNVTTTYCTNDVTTLRADDVSDVSLAPIIPLLEHTCVETLQEHCYQEPEVTHIKTSVKRCLVRIHFLVSNIFTQIFR